MHYKLHDPMRTSYRQPFYGYGYGFGAEGGPTTIPGSSTGSTPAADATTSITGSGTTLSTAGTKQGAAQKKASFSIVSPILAFGTSFLASYIVARHIEIDKPKSMNLAITMGLLSGIGQLAAQVLQGWIEKAQSQIESGAADKLLSSSSGTQTGTKA